MIGATRATWGRVFRMTLSRAPTFDKGLLVAPRGPKVKKRRFSAVFVGPLGAGTWPHLACSTGWQREIPTNQPKMRQKHYVR